MTANTDIINRVARAQRTALLEITGGTLPDNLFEAMAGAAIEAMGKGKAPPIDAALSPKDEGEG